MRRILLVMSVAALMVAMIVASAMPAFAFHNDRHTQGATVYKDAQQGPPYTIAAPGKGPFVIEPGSEEGTCVVLFGGPPSSVEQGQGPPESAGPGC